MKQYRRLSFGGGHGGHHKNGPGHEVLRRIILCTNHLLSFLVSNLPFGKLLHRRRIYFLPYGTSGCKWRHPLFFVNMYTGTKTRDNNETHHPPNGGGTTHLQMIAHACPRRLRSTLNAIESRTRRLNSPSSVTTSTSHLPLVSHSQAPWPGLGSDPPGSQQTWRAKYHGLITLRRYASIAV